MRAAEARRDARARLVAADVPNAAGDADALLAHVLGTDRAGLIAAGDVGVDQLATYRALIDRRCAREPLQHLVGAAAFRHLEVEVGPGVFVPRPETELLAGWAIDEVRARAAGAGEAGVSCLDLCTGSGVIAKAVATEAPEATVTAVELEPDAHAYAERNLAGTDVELILGDALTACRERAGTIDVIVSNPPYVPLEAWESVAPEARDHDPQAALFAGPDGLEMIRGLVAHAERLLRSGGAMGVEHAEVQGDAVPDVFASSGRWTRIRRHRDLAGRPRFTTAVLAAWDA